VKRRDALLALGIDHEETQDGYLEYDDMLVLDEFAIFGTNFETVLRSKFPKYEEIEKQGKEEGWMRSPSSPATWRTTSRRIRPTAGWK
jgi:hypothetical protein